MSEWHIEANTQILSVLLETESSQSSQRLSSVVEKLPHFISLFQNDSKIRNYINKEWRAKTAMERMDSEDELPFLHHGAAFPEGHLQQNWDLTALGSYRGQD